ncbi:MAG: hypothetical protein P4L79_10830 [Legionella sp.]|uniref:hypothetical protein n=1 Tax=Legionella sp. TaxID=459 RepID=UPI00284830F1|nr:hypothetical protein [Legionella sp.]
MSEEFNREEYYLDWEKALERAGYKSLIPVADYFSTDLTEAHIMLDMWIREGLIVKVDV